MAVTVKLKNHQSYVVNKKRARNVNYPGVYTIQLCSS